MFPSFRFLGYRAKCVALITIAAGLSAAAQSLDSVSASTATPPPYALFQNATLTGTGNTLTANWLPVLTTTGTAYENITIEFAVDSKGNLTIAPGYPQIAPAPPILVSAFKAGTYVGPGTIYSGEMVVAVAGPGVLSGGATAWSLAAAANAYYCTFPASANWWTGPIASSPIAARLAAAGITSNAWSYGLGGSGCESTVNNAAWYPNSLVGASQSGNTITFASFTDSNGKDHSTPQDQVVYTLTN